MGTRSRLSDMQLAEQWRRLREGRVNKTAMTNVERREAGLMDRRQAAEHERLAAIPPARRAERSRGPAPDDIWAAGEDA